MSLATNTRNCKRPCIYLDKQIGCCNYYLETGNRRPCQPGKDCTVREAGQRRSYWHNTKSRKPAWDVAKARQLRQDGWSWQRIGQEVGASADTIAHFFRSHGEAKE